MTKFSNFMSSEEIFGFGCLGETTAEWECRFGMEAIDVQANSLEDITRQIVDHFSNVSRTINGIKFTMWELNGA